MEEFDDLPPNLPSPPPRQPSNGVVPIPPPKDLMIMALLK